MMILWCLPRQRLRTGISDALMDKYEVLKNYFGYDKFRQGQSEIIDAVESGRDVLGVMPTGAGKSMCYQIPALMKPGFAVVISPLISLMQDQVRSLVELGIRAAYINSSLSMSQLYAVINNCAQGIYKLVYVAPERLDSEVFVNMAINADISMICVDEAHCISQWGQDFRPSYLGIPEFIAKLPKRPVVAAFTATATDKVREDIRELLHLSSPFELVTGFDRENLYFEVRQPADKNHDLVRLVGKYCNDGRSGIVYCSTRKDVEAACELLRERGIPCVRYHAGLSDEERKKNQDDFIYDRVRVITATNAFGMGIDKSNVSFVIHYNMPKDLESYYQEAGRAGRDGSQSDCILMYSPRDTVIARYLIDKSYEESALGSEEAEKVRQRDMKRLWDMVNYSKNTSCLRSYILRYFGEKGVYNCCNCSNCCKGAELSDITVDSQKIMSCIFRSGEQHNIKWVSDILRGELPQGTQHEEAESLSTFGIMNGANESYIFDICETLRSRGLISAENNGAVSLTAKALPVLRGQMTLNARLSSDITARTSRRSDDSELAARLRAVRDKLARKQRVPAYVILADSVITELSEKKPVTERSFMDIQGITRAKYDRYADSFIAEILEWQKEKGIPVKTRQSRDQSEKSADVIREMLNGLEDIELSAKDVTISELCSNIIVRAKEKHEKRISPNTLRMMILSRLSDEGYIRNVYDDAGHLSRETTQRSADIGISSYQVKNSAGESFTRIVYNTQAQSYVLGLFGMTGKAADKQG